MKKLLMIFVSVILLITLASCGAPEVKDSSVFFTGTVDSGILNDNAVFATHTTTKTKEFTDSSVENTKSIKINDQVYQISYIKSTQQGESRPIHTYQTKDEKIDCYYFGTSEQLAQISIEDEEISPLGKLATEKEYTSWVESVLNQFGVDDLSAYEYSCETKVITSGADFAGKRSEEGFYIAREDLQDTTERVSSYTFQFRKYLGGIRTSDVTEVYISGYGVIIRFDEKRFADMDAPIQDTKAYDKIVEEFVKNSISEKYTLVSYEAGTPRLYYKDEKLCLGYAVDVELKDNVSGGTIAAVFSVAVDVNAIK